jgi:DNA-binding GntR family transcriptional regulator
MAIFEALKAGDAEGAEAAMRKHLTRQREALRQLAKQHNSRVVKPLAEQDKQRALT